MGSTKDGLLKVLDSQQSYVKKDRLEQVETIETLSARRPEKLDFESMRRCFMGKLRDCANQLG